MDQRDVVGEGYDEIAEAYDEYRSDEAPAQFEDGIGEAFFEELPAGESRPRRRMRRWPPRCSNDSTETTTPSGWTSRRASRTGPRARSRFRVRPR